MNEGLRTFARDPDKKTVSAFERAEPPTDTGCEMLMVTRSGDLSRAVPARLVSKEPYRLEVLAGVDFPVGSDVLLVTPRPTGVMRSKLHVTSSEANGKTTVIGGEVTCWEEADRRRHPRVRTDLNAELRFVNDTPAGVDVETVQGRVSDLSVSGACMRVDGDYSQGLLARWAIDVGPGTQIEGLALVVRSGLEDSTVALHFIEFFHGSESGLESLVERLIAA